METEIGTIAFFKPDGNFGFIASDGSADVFFHVSDCQAFVPRLGQRVRFERGEDRRGRPKATHVREA